MLSLFCKSSISADFILVLCIISANTWSLFTDYIWFSCVSFFWAYHQVECKFVCSNDCRKCQKFPKLLQSESHPALVKDLMTECQFVEMVRVAPITPTLHHRIVSWTTTQLFTDLTAGQISYFKTYSTLAFLLCTMICIVLTLEIKKSYLRKNTLSQCFHSKKKKIWT